MEESRRGERLMASCRISAERPNLWEHLVELKYFAGIFVIRQEYVSEQIIREVAQIISELVDVRMRGNHCIARAYG